MKDSFKEFKPSSWAINNRTAVYILTVIVTLMGLMAYNSLPKRKIPGNKISADTCADPLSGYISGEYGEPGTQADRKQVKNLTGVKNSYQQFVPGLFDRYRGV